MRRILGIAASLMLTFLVAQVALAYSQTDISGTVANNASWAHYLTQRNATDYSYGVRLSTLSWSGTDQYYYLRKCINDDPIGAGSANSPIKAAVNDTAFKQLGPLTNGTCFRMNAKKDWSWPSGSSWWTGTLRY
jgi:hypothetical protein